MHSPLLSWGTILWESIVFFLAGEQSQCRSFIPDVKPWKWPSCSRNSESPTCIEISSRQRIRQPIIHSLHDNTSLVSTYPHISMWNLNTNKAIFSRKEWDVDKLTDVPLWMRVAARKPHTPNSVRRGQIVAKVVPWLEATSFLKKTTRGTEMPEGTFWLVPFQKQSAASDSPPDPRLKYCSWDASKKGANQGESTATWYYHASCKRRNSTRRHHPWPNNATTKTTPLPHDADML